MTHISRNATTTSFALPIASAVHHLIAAVVNWNDARVTRKALSRLTDRELNDIGLVRGDIDEVSRF
ncbi:DUF1127 domain-containing protein [Oceanicola sp. S124]|uniref:DUF1127 domain-containing protein n=1 Tax=Oceanicola sp. S124 TaxID=1042378 RepID=UPI00025579F9|nr:DUF1127 domain-containing protein [Oceanicola sp. S124]